MKNSIFAWFARAFFIFWHFKDVLVLSTTWNDLFCSCVDDVSIWWQMFNFVFLCSKRWFQFNSRIVRTHLSSKMTLKNDCRKAKLYFQMTFSLPSTSCLLKLPVVYGLSKWPFANNSSTDSPSWIRWGFWQIQGRKTLLCGKNMYTFCTFSNFFLNLHFCVGVAAISKTNYNQNCMLQ